MAHFERGHLNNVLELTRWDVEEAAEMLGISQETLRAKMRQDKLRQWKS